MYSPAKLRHSIPCRQPQPLWREIADGYKKFASDGSFHIEINPAGPEAAVFSEKDDVILICDNPLSSNPSVRA